MINSDTIYENLCLDLFLGKISEMEFVKQMKKLGVDDDKIEEEIFIAKGTFDSGL